MNMINPTNLQEVEPLLERARSTRASASIRPEGEVRMFGQLHVSGYSPLEGIRLEGAKRREQLPGDGTLVTLSLVLGETVVCIRTRITGVRAQEGEEAGAREVFLAWPDQPLEIRHRKEVRVATADLPPLGATLRLGDGGHPALLLNLTETGLGLGLQELLPFAAHQRVEVETALPGGDPFRVHGYVRHAEVLDNDPLPCRVGLILEEVPDPSREMLQRFIQARRMDRTETLRGH